MQRFEPTRYYATRDPDLLGVFGAYQTLADWRHRGTGPPYVKLRNRVLYLGSDLNHYLDARRVEPLA